jgi:hypothetical protein
MIKVQRQARVAWCTAGIEIRERGVDLTDAWRPSSNGGTIIPKVKVGNSRP